MSVSALIALVSGLLYLAAGYVLARGHYRTSPNWPRAAIGLALLGIAGHAVFVGLRLGTPVGWDVNFVNILSLATLMIALVLVLTAAGTRSMEAGILVFPGAAVILWLQWLGQPAPMFLGHLPVMLKLHILTALLAFSLLAIAALNAIMLWLQDYLLRHPRPMRQLELLPPLVVLEQLMFRLILAGWLLLSVALGAGLTFVDDLLAQHLLHKTALSVISWVLFGLLLGARWWQGWRGRRAVNWTLVAMAMLVLAYFGSKFILEQLLDRSWSRTAMALAGVS
ncbi:MAG: inner membrane protein YpjD [Wenzhouxiangella sp.]